MIPNETVIEGTIQPDGTLVLDQPTKLPAGRVKVVLRREVESQPVLEDWWQFMRRSRRELESSGDSFMSESDVNEHVEWLREGDPIDEMLQGPGPS